MVQILVGSPQLRTPTVWQRDKLSTPPGRPRTLNLTLTRPLQRKSSRTNTRTICMMMNFSRGMLRDSHCGRLTLSVR